MSHLDLIPDVYAKLSVLYSLKGQYKLAYEHLIISNKLNEVQFGSRSKDNQGLLEIKDDFRMEKERQGKLIQEEQLATLEQINKNRALQALILWISLPMSLCKNGLVWKKGRHEHCYREDADDSSSKPCFSQ